MHRFQLQTFSLVRLGASSLDPKLAVECFSLEVSPVNNFDIKIEERKKHNFAMFTITNFGVVLGFNTGEP